jgi:hypothetical protein
MNRRFALVAGAMLAAGTSNAMSQNIWGEAGVSLGRYSEPSFNYHETYAEAWGQVQASLPSGFNIALAAGIGRDFTEEVTYGGLDTDIFYANQSFALGIYAGLFATNDFYNSSFAGVQGAAFIGMFDIGAWAGWEGNGIYDDNHAAGAWLAYWLNPNTDIGARFWWEGNDDYNSHAIGIFAEHQFAARPWSIWANAEFGENSNPMTTFNFWNASVGVTYFFNPPGTSLQEHYHVMPF